jgi:hypothetical protein
MHHMHSHHVVGLVLQAIRALHRMQHAEFRLGADVDCVAENRALALAHHQLVRAEVQADILRMFERVDRVCSLVHLDQYSFPTEEGEAFLWRQALRAAQCMLAMIPSLPEGQEESSDHDVWREHGFWDVNA